MGALIDCTREWMRVLKPSGSIWVDLGDKYSGGASGEQSGLLSHPSHTRGGMQPVSVKSRPARGMRPKSLMLLPERGRVQGDTCVGCPDRTSPDQSGRELGHSLDGAHYVIVPPREQMNDPDAWYVHFPAESTGGQP